VSEVPHFIIIGAMKCATTTLHEQLAQQSGFFMTSKIEEPSFFSDDRNYARGIAWYHALFTARDTAQLCGESSTNYTKLPEFPLTIERMRKYLPHVKLIYIMRHPVDRLISHYIHDWSERRIDEPIGSAIHSHAEMINYGKYAMQLKPYLDTYGPSRVLPIFFESLVLNPEKELSRVFKFLDWKKEAHWHAEGAVRNESKERMRKSALRDAIVWNPVVTWFRRSFVPQSIRDWAKSRYQMRERPVLATGDVAYLEKIFDEDMVVLGKWLGLDLTCRNWKNIASTVEPCWGDYSHFKFCPVRDGT